jgi:3-oxoadipate enol-lactonase
MPYLTCNHARIYYHESGSGKETIIFSHGLLFDHRMWNAQVDHFSNEFRCIAYDHRGQGKSEVVGNEDMDTLYEDAAALIEKLNGGQPVHFVGLSMGGFIGMRLAARKPHLIKTLSLLETSADEEPNKFKYGLLNTIFKLGGASLVSGKIIRILFGKSAMQNPERKEIISFWESTIRSYPTNITKAVEGVINRKGIISELKRIISPTLVTVGDEDIATITAKAEQIHASIKNSYLIIIPGVGHSSCIENPQLISKILYDFVKNQLTNRK